MNISDTASADNGPARRVSGRRDTAITAPLRCASYAALSELVASPHDLDPRPALRDKLGVPAGLPWGGALDELLAEFVELDLGHLKAEYSGLFEVGSNGPPLPIREDLQTGQRGGTREDIVRFYDYFGYRLEEHFAWAPDHLSVELEFMHFLCFREAGDDGNAQSYQLGQADFQARHLNRWVPDFAGRVAGHVPDAVYARVMTTLSDFLRADHAWQQSTIVDLAGEASA